jgi:ubiquinone/menaquinone biosynthesis C-methylase UbiE
VKIADSRELHELRDLLSASYNGLSPNMSSDLGSLRYVKNAEKIKRYFPEGRILDWGCGLGQMSYLLKNRGLEVVSFDVDQVGRPFLERIGQSLVLAADPVKLPFPDASFAAVLSSGVLEHVADQRASLREVNRIMKVGGSFFIFLLPNRYSYIEFIADSLGRGDHPIKYSIGEIRQQLEQSGFEIVSLVYKGFFPYNLKGFPAAVSRLYHKFDLVLEKLDALFAALPLINRFCTNLELVARKK